MKDCNTYMSLIPDFIKNKLSFKKQRELLEHVENCKNCYDELEVQFMIDQTMMSDDEVAVGDLQKNLKKIIVDFEKKVFFIRLFNTFLIFFVILLVAILICLFLFYKG